MKERLKEEAQHFMYTLLNMPLPPCIDRLRLPMVITPSKKATIELQQDLAATFHRRMLPSEKRHSGRSASASSTTASKSGWTLATKHLWYKNKVARELPNRHRTVKSTQET